LGLIPILRNRVLDQKTKITAEKNSSKIDTITLKEVKDQKHFEILNSLDTKNKENKNIIHKYVPSLKKAVIRNKLGKRYFDRENEQLILLLKNKKQDIKSFEKSVLSMNKENILNLGGGFEENDSVILYQALKFKNKKYCLSYVIKRTELSSKKISSKIGLHD
jgi:hypothetical protein